jgi:hypothetical protein
MGVKFSQQLRYFKIKIQYLFFLRKSYIFVLK